MNITRRDVLSGLAGALLTGGAAGLLEKRRRLARGKQAAGLNDPVPRSMLHTAETPVHRAKFPVIDFHTHMSLGDDLKGPGNLDIFSNPEALLPYMDARGIRMLVDLTGGFGDDFERTLAVFQKPAPTRFSVFVQPWWNRLREPGYAQFQADEIAKAHRLGARGLKVLKTLGLRLRENVESGPLVRVDDKRFDPMWEVCGALRIPVAIHTSDPEAFFRPADRFNERYEELQAHPRWSLYGKDLPSNESLQQARCRLMARHPGTQFVCLHVADAENLDYVSHCLDTYPNMHVDIAARIAELGRQPRKAKAFFDRYQDRTLFGTDAVGAPGDRFYEPYFRFLETEDEYFPYSDDGSRSQGRWKIYGIGLPDAVLRKVYYGNAARLLGFST